jgi:hypothetical protein
MSDILSFWFFRFPVRKEYVLNVRRKTVILTLAGSEYEQESDY